MCSALVAETTPRLRNFAWTVRHDEGMNVARSVVLQVLVELRGVVIEDTEGLGVAVALGLLRGRIAAGFCVCV